MELIRAKIYLLLETKSKLFVGISGAQGSGKSTFALELRDDLSSNIDCVILSLDDFYLTNSERDVLGKEIHPLLRARGVPGTHDMELLQTAIDSVFANESAEWPVFSKKHDERNFEERNFFVRKYDKLVVILEGWCVGCSALTGIETPINDLERFQDPDCVWRNYINDAIKNKYFAIWEKLDLFVYLKIPSWEIVHSWRTQQAIGNNEDLSKFNVARFMEFFERISKQMLDPAGRMHTNFVIFLGNNHSINDIAIN
jgi:D-glycerate 3-kinase